MISTENASTNSASSKEKHIAQAAHCDGVTSNCTLMAVSKGSLPYTHFILHSLVFSFTTSLFFLSFIFLQCTWSFGDFCLFTQWTCLSFCLFSSSFPCCLHLAAHLKDQRPPQLYYRVIWSLWGLVRGTLIRFPGFSPCLTRSPTYFHHFNSGMLKVDLQISKLVADFVL